MDAFCRKLFNTKSVGSTFGTHGSGSPFLLAIRAVLGFLLLTSYLCKVCRSTAVKFPLETVTHGSRFEKCKTFSEILLSLFPEQTKLEIPQDLSLQISCHFSPDDLQGRERYPNLTFATKIWPNFRVNFLVWFASRPLFYWIVPSNCPEKSLVLFVRFFVAFGVLFWLLKIPVPSTPWESVSFWGFCTDCNLPHFEPFSWAKGWTRFCGQEFYGHLDLSDSWVGGVWESWIIERGVPQAYFERTCVKRNIAFGARFKGLSLYFRYIKMGIWYVSKRAWIHIWYESKPVPPCDGTPLMIILKICSCKDQISWISHSVSASPAYKWSSWVAMGGFLAYNGTWRLNT